MERVCWNIFFPPQKLDISKGPGYYTRRQSNNNKQSANLELFCELLAGLQLQLKILNRDRAVLYFKSSSMQILTKFRAQLPIFKLLQCEILVGFRAQSTIFKRINTTIVFSIFRKILLRFSVRDRGATAVFVLPDIGSDALRCIADAQVMWYQYFGLN